MKRIILTVVAMAAFLSASAQIEKNTILVGASSNLNFSSYSPSGGGSTTSITQVGLKGGYFLAENFALGLNFNYYSVSSSSATTIGVFGRYYPGGKFFLGAGYNSVSSGSTSQGQFNAEAGYAAFINKSIAIEPALNYNSGDGYSMIGLAVGFTLYLNRAE